MEPTLTSTDVKAKAGSIKCVVWDLDNTVWNGVLLEDKQVTIRPEVVACMKELDRRGILQSIASKNNYKDAWEKLTHFELSYLFLYPQIGWHNKSISIKNIQEKLNIGMDAIAFIDDQPFEREEVQHQHPDVVCYPDTVTGNMLEMKEFMPRFVTPESAMRRSMYQSDAQRNDIEENYESNHAFLESLNLKFSIQRATVDDLQRVEELTVRTNQLNATGYTYSYDELEQFLDSPNHQIYVASLEDKYGTYGKIGVAMVEANNDVWSLKLLLMSCRVMSRGVGGVLLGYLIKQARAQQKVLQGTFFPTDRNRLMYMTYKFSGFQEFEKRDDGGVIFRHPLTEDPVFPAYIELITPEGRIQ